MASVATDRRQGVNSGAAIKVPVKAATTANITLSGEQTIDGVALVDGDRVLVKNQTTASENGIYEVDTSTWSRAPDWDGSYDVKEGTFVYVTDGTVNAALFYSVTTADPITIGTTSVAFAVVTPSSVLTLPLGVAQGGTGQDTATEAAAALGLVQLTGGAGTANAHTAGAPSNFSAFAANQLFTYTAGATNTAALTLTVTPSGGAALAAQDVHANGAACVGGEIVTGREYLLLHDGTRLNVIGALTASGILDISGANQGQIKFPATQNASSDANTLDDYEEGTFTPGITFGNGSTGMTFTTQTGTYTKVGREVHAHIQVNLLAKGSSTGAARVSGLPFTASASQQFATAVRWNAMNSALAHVVLVGGNGAATASFFGSTAGSTSPGALTDANFADSSQVIGTVVYHL